MANVDAAEKEASEVLHSLLSVERIVKPDHVKRITDEPNLVVDNNNAISTHFLFEDHFPATIDEEQVNAVVWQGHRIQVETNEISLYTNEESPIVEDIQEDIKIEEIKEVKNLPPKTVKLKTKLKNDIRSKKVKIKKRKDTAITNWEPTKLEDNASQVKERFKRGCECQDESCFRGLSPESVYRHRLNIAELTKGEHDMYLMGVTMACLANPDITVRHKERQRLRAQYVYQGRRVCLDAFLYLENCTHYQLKRIRKHVMTHGVAPRVHGNHGKKPHNTFSLDIYQHATEFLKQYLETHTGDSNVSNSKGVIQLPWDITRKNLHNAYKEYGQMLEPGVKLMGYSTFRHFLKEQFPHVRFCKIEPKSNSSSFVVQNNTAQNQTYVEISDALKVEQNNVNTTVGNTEVVSTHQVLSTAGGEVQQVIPLVVSGNETTQHQQAATFLVAPVSQLIPGAGGNLVTMQSTSTNNGATSFPYQINTGYVINEQGNIVANQHQYTFNRM